MCVSLDKGTWHDKESGDGGGVLDMIQVYAHTDRRGALAWLKARGHLSSEASSKPRIVATYPYPDAAGKVAFEVVRYKPKDFKQRRPDGKGGFVWNMDGVELVPYRLPALVAAVAAGRTVYIPEGEKGVEALQHRLGHAATCSPGGAGKWRSQYNSWFAGADVVVLSDNDPQTLHNKTGEPLWHPDGRPKLAGQDHAADVARNLQGIAARVCVLMLPGLPIKGDVFDWIEAGGTAAELTRLADELLEQAAPAPLVNDAPQEAKPGDPTDLQCRQLDPIAPNLLPPRPWAYGKFLLFGSAAVIGAVDGAGKGSVAVVMALAMITGKPLLGEKVWRKGAVVIVTYEDDEMEWHRRIAAACLHHGLDYAEALRGFYFVRKPGGRVSFGASLGGVTVFPDSAGIIAILRQVRAVGLIVDPFNHAHELDDGNSNPLIARIAGEMGRIAAEANVAVLVLHHLRKGSTGQVDDLMGATSLRATFRSCRILTRMSAEEGEALNVEDTWRYLRNAGSKGNYAPPPHLVTWFKLDSIELGNATPDYPDGDNIGVATIWIPPSPFEGLSLPTIAEIFDGIRTGPGEGDDRYTFTRGGKSSRWLGDLIVSLAGKEPNEAAAIVAIWREQDVLREDTYRNSKRRNVLGVSVNEAKAAAILAGIRSSGADAE